MKNFLVHYHAPAEVMAQVADATPEQKADGMKPWMAWKEKAGDKILDFGAPTVGAFRLNADGSESHRQSEVTGYSLIQARDIDEAKSLLKSHPHLKWADKVAIEVFECCEM